jgi:hypothetical protein
VLHLVDDTTATAEVYSYVIVARCGRQLLKPEEQHHDDFNDPEEEPF